MGTRVNYEICGDADGSPGAILFSNSHHECEHPENVFHELVKTSAGSRGLLLAVLSAKYKTSFGQHNSGDFMFSLDFCPEDRERVMRVTYGGATPVLTSLNAAGLPENWVGMEKKLEGILRQTAGDQGGGCTFQEWVAATANDSGEFMHEEAYVFEKYRTPGVLKDSFII